MKKIFFIHRQSTMFGELKAKFNGQMRACQNLGYDVYYLEWNGNEIDLVQFGTDKRKCMVKTPLIMPMETYYHIVYHSKLYKAAAKAFKTVHFDYVYMRSNVAMPSVKEMIAAVPNDTKFFLEIPTYPFEEDAAGHKGLKWTVGRAISDKYAPIYQNRADQIILISVDDVPELFGRPTFSIENGTDTETLKKREPVKSDKIHILCLANMRDYHGYDRVIEGLAVYPDKDRVIVDFVGRDADGCLSRWKELAHEKGLDSYICYHGPVYGEGLDELFDLADVGMGCLAGFRKHTYDTNELKVRDYMGRGLPFVQTLHDSAIPQDYPYALKISNDNTPVDIQAVVALAERCRNDKNCVDNMRSYAAEHMSWTAQFKKLFSEIG